MLTTSLAGLLLSSPQLIVHGTPLPRLVAVLAVFAVSLVLCYVAHCDCVTGRYVGADLQALVNEASLRAVCVCTGGVCWVLMVCVCVSVYVCVWMSVCMCVCVLREKACVVNDRVCIYTCV